ncbi:MAG: aromatic ring-hydroxylating oxygenase subunit alpha [Caulobacter sp.]
MTSMTRPTVLMSDADLGADRIGPERFTSQAMLAEELKWVFGRSWLLACPVSDIASPGDAFPFTVGQDPLVVVRGEDGQVRAFHNVCRHRGRQLVTRPRNIKSFYCWFHGFDWHLDGSVRDIPDKACFKGYTNEEDLVLPAVQCEVWGGFAWVNMDPGAPPLLDFLGPVADQLSAYRLEEYRLAEDLLVEWDCNWKIGADAFQEGYHGPVTHPQLQYFLEDGEDMPMDLYELHSRGLYKIGAPCTRLPEADRRRAHPMLKQMAAGVGVDADAFEGRLEEMRLAMQAGRRATLTAKGCDVSALTDDQMTDDFHYFVFPNITLNMFAERFSVFRYMPHPTDPTKMTFWLQRFERAGPDEPRGKRVETTFGSGPDFRFDNEVYNQDAANVPWVQKGVGSRSFKGMLFNSQERRLRHFYHNLDRYLDPAKPPWA